MDQLTDSRAARPLVVIVGAGYSGTEVAAQGQLFTRAALRRYPRIRPEEFRWLLVDRASNVLPELGARLGDSALRFGSEDGVGPVTGARRAKRAPRTAPRPGAPRGAPGVN